MAQAVGLDGMDYLEEEDPFKILVTDLLIDRSIELKDQWNERLAIDIATQVGKAFSKA